MTYLIIVVYCILVYKCASLIIVNNDLKKNVLEIIGVSVEILVPIVGRCTSKGIFIRQEDLTLNTIYINNLILKNFVQLRASNFLKYFNFIKKFKKYNCE